VSDHHFDSLTQTCLGCDLTMAELANGRADGADGRNKPDPRLAACPSTCQLINDDQAGILAVIAAPDRLVVTSGGGVILRLGADAARAMFETAAPMLKRWVHVGDKRARH